MKAKNRFSVGLKLWVSTPGSAGVFGQGKYRLLRAVDEHGSLRKAAQHNGISYRKAWGDIKKAEARLGRKLLVRERGGKGGGTSRLTPFARKLLDAYDAFQTDIARYSEKAFKNKLGRFFK